MRTIAQPNHPIVTDRYLDRLSDMMAARLGTKYKFRWMLGISFEIPVYYQDGYAKYTVNPDTGEKRPVPMEGQDEQGEFKRLISAGQPVSDTVPSANQVRVHEHNAHLIPSGLDTSPGIWVPKRGYHWQPLLQPEAYGFWTMAVKSSGMSMEDWYRCYGLELPYPENGYWKPVIVPDNELSYCFLPPGVLPNESNTQNFIDAMLLDRSIPFGKRQLMANQKRKEKAAEDMAKDRAMDKLKPYSQFGNTYITTSDPTPKSIVRPIAGRRSAKPGVIIEGHHASRRELDGVAGHVILGTQPLKETAKE